MTDVNTNAPYEEKVSEFSYDGYQVVRGEFFAHLFEPSVTLKDEKVSVNAACLRKLPDVEYVQFLVNPGEKKLAVKPCPEDAKDSFCWATHSSDGKRKPKNITCRIFYAKIMNLMGWDPAQRHQILGKLIRTESEAIFVFDLTSAKAFNRKGSSAGASRKPMYPSQWQDQFGLTVQEHKDTVLINIFDDYTVFRIERNEGGEKDNGEDKNAEDIDSPGLKEEQDQDTPKDLEKARES